MPYRIRRRGRQNLAWRTYRVTSLLLRTLLIINRERTRVVRAHARGDYGARPNLDVLLRVLREFRVTAVEMGGLLIKLGQFLGTRADLLPPEALGELAALHDDVPAEPFAEIQRLIERQLHAPLSEIFPEIETKPVGSASLGQVHRARLADGRLVAVKVQRPGIGRIVEADLRALRIVLALARRFAPAANQIVDFDALYREFSRTVYEELDYQREGQNAERFAQIFAGDDTVVAPGVYWQYSTRRVLTLEWMDGIKISQVEELDRAGVDRDALARQVADAYFKQVLEVGFFHADPHPGNLLVQPGVIAQGVDGAGGAQARVRLVFVDFGMMGVITPRMRNGMRDCFAGVVQRDTALVVRGLDRLGFLSPSADREVIEQIAGTMLTRFGGMPVGQLRDVNQREVAGEFGDILYDQPFRLPSQLAFFGRAVGMLFGLTLTLSPSFNFIEVAAPYAQRLIGRGEGLLALLGVENAQTLGQDALREGVAIARSLVALPSRLDRVLNRLERGELRVIIEPDLDQRQRRQFQRNIVTGTLRRPIPLWAPLGVAGALGLALLVRGGARRDAKAAGARPRLSPAQRRQRIRALGWLRRALAPR